MSIASLRIKPLDVHHEEQKKPLISSRVLSPSLESARVKVQEALIKTLNPNFQHFQDVENFIKEGSKKRYPKSFVFSPTYFTKVLYSSSLDIRSIRTSLPIAIAYPFICTVISLAIGILILDYTKRSVKVERPVTEKLEELQS